MQKRPISLTIICAFCLVAIALTVVFYLRLYNRDPFPGQALEKVSARKWHLFMIVLQLPIIISVCLMFFLKRIGLWLFLAGKVLFIALPGIAGVELMGLLTPIFFIESASFFILFGKKIHYMN